MRCLEFMNAAKVITDYYLGIKPGENILIVRDTLIGEFPGAEALVEAVLSSISFGGGEPLSFKRLPRQKLYHLAQECRCFRLQDIFLIL